MENLITLAYYDNPIDIKYNLLKEMLEEDSIEYITINENMRSVKPFPFMLPSNLAIEIKVFERDFPKAKEILESIK